MVMILLAMFIAERPVWPRWGGDLF